MKLLDIVRQSAESLEKSSIDDPLADAELIAYHASGVDRMAAFLDNPEIDSRTAAKIRRLVARRIKGEPVQYITGEVEFCGLRISVGRGVLIPRPETELLVEEAIKTVPPPVLSILDLCTGSGCIALALAKHWHRAEVLGIDISARALSYAKKNAALNGISNAVFMKGHLFGPLAGRRKQTLFELITANPPYIISSEIPELQREVRDWEPAMALDGGGDGLDFYRSILSGAGDFLTPGGHLMLELGYGQAEEVAILAACSGFSDIRVLDDFAGIGRVLICALNK